MTKRQVPQLEQVRTREEALEKAAPWMAVSWAGIAETAWYYTLGRGLGNTDNVIFFKNLSGTEKRELFIEVGRCLVKGSPEEAVNFVMAKLARDRTN